MKHLALAIGIAISLSACAPVPAAPPPVDTAAEETALKATTAVWLNAYNAGDVEKMVAMYEEDAVLMPPHAGVAKGRAEIRAFLTADTAGAKAAGIKLMPGAETAGVVGDWGWVRPRHVQLRQGGAAAGPGGEVRASDEPTRAYPRCRVPGRRPLKDRKPPVRAIVGTMTSATSVPSGMPRPDCAASSN